MKILFDLFLYLYIHEHTKQNTSCIDLSLRSVKCPIVSYQEILLLGVESINKSRRYNRTSPDFKLFACRIINGIGSFD